MRRRAVKLAGAAAAIVAAQQVVVVLMLRLANGGPDGTVVLWGLAQTVFLVVWAVLALPLSTTVFPRLAELADDRLGFDRLLAGAARAVLLAGGLGVAVLVGLAGPLGHLLAGVTATQPPPRPLVLGILAFAPGVLGYGVVALLNRALVAAGGARAAAVAAVAAVVGWGTAAAAAWLLATSLSGADRVPALALANSIGMTVWAAALCSAVARRRGSAALAGCLRTLLMSLLGAVVAGGLGWTVAGMIAGSDSAGWSLVPAIMAGGVVIAVYGVIAAFDRDASAPVSALGSALVRRWGAGRR